MRSWGSGSGSEFYVPPASFPSRVDGDSAAACPQRGGLTLGEFVKRKGFPKAEALKSY